MKTESEIKQKLEEIESDERLSYPPAIVQTNAPLALTQTELEAKVKILKWILGISKTIVLILLLFIIQTCENIQSPVIIITNNKCENGIITVAEVHKQWELIDSVVVITEITKVIIYTDSIGFQTINVPVEPGRYSVTLDCMILDYVDLSSEIHYVVDSEMMGANVTDHSMMIYIEF